jgi:sodium transport system permease protein
VTDQSPPPLFDLGRLWRFTRKELREVLRDRRTILTLVLMPLLLYPLLAVGLRQLFVTSTTTPGPVEYRIGFVNVRDEDLFENSVLPAARHAQQRSEQKVQDGPAKGLPKLMSHQGTEDKIEQDLRDGVVHVVVRFHPVPPPPGWPVRTPYPPPWFAWDITLLEGSPLGVEVLDFVRGQFALSNMELLQDRLVPGGTEMRGPPLVWSTSTVSPLPSPPKTGVLTTLIPLILVLMTITGAVYPAIDLTAGERERGTLEVLMAAPVPRRVLLMAKFAAVWTVALLTALVNLCMMTLTTLTMGLGPILFGPQGVTVLLIVQVLALLVLFALFFSAVLLALTSFARSFKEAQAYLVPLMLLSLAPGVATLLPDLSLRGPLSVTPLMNVVLLARDVFADKVEPDLAFVVVASTLLYAALALALAARIFGAEAVLYSDQGGWGDLLRRPAEARPVASLSTALLCLAILFPAQFMLSGAIAQMEQPELVRALLLAFVGVVLFVGFPLAAALFERVNLVSGFRLKPPPLLGLVGGLVLGLSLWPFAALLVLLLKQVGQFAEQNGLNEQVRRLIESWQESGAGVTLILMAVLPAVAEEWLFRGYLFGAVRAVSRPRTAILVSALLFGVFHVVIGGLLSWERLLTTTLLGLVLGWVRWKTDSLWPGMVLHTCHNGLLVAAALAKEGGPLGSQDPTWETLLPWLAGGAVGATLGALLVAFGRQSRADSDI